MRIGAHQDGAAPAAQGLGVTGLLAAGFTAAAVPLTLTTGEAGVRVLLVCVVTAGISCTMWAPLWHRLPHRASLAMLPVALALITAHNVLAEVDPFRYGVYYLLVFSWIGTYHRPGTAVRWALPTALSYLLPLLAQGYGDRWGTVVYAVPIYVVVGELLSHRGAQLWQLAHVDELTGLENRRAFLQRLDDLEVRSAGAPAPRDWVVIYLDLNGFKAINDRFGHLAGDHVLRSAAAAMLGAVRPGDVIGRLGGDEFAVLAPVDDLLATEARVRRLRQALERVDVHAAITAATGEQQPVGAPLTLSVSVGHAVCDQQRSPRRALQDADVLMYADKQVRHRALTS